MKKFLLIFLTFILLSGFASAYNIAYIVGNPAGMTADESAVNDFLVAHGNNVIIKDDVSFNASVYDLIIVGNSVNDISSVFDNTNYRTVFLSAAAAKKAGFSYSSGIATDRTVNVIDNSQYITQGFSLGDNTIYTSTQTINFISGCKAANIKMLAYQSRTIDTNTVIMTADETARLIVGNDCTKKIKPMYTRNAFFGMVKAASWNDDAKSLFLRTIDWVSLGEDMDGDGYCKAGSLIQNAAAQCPNEFGTVGTDCNDQNASVHPNAVEIPYDHVDETCQGYDLADVDGDGYCQTGYLITNKAVQCLNEPGIIGTDCNDNDNSYNLNSTDQKKDCINEPPIFDGSIADISWNEDGYAYLNLTDYFSDIEEDALMFGIYNTSEDQNVTIDFYLDGTVRFNSAEDWSGNDWIVFYATDGQNVTTTNLINMNVFSVNDAPELLNQIPDVSFKADVNYNVDLSNYFADVDSSITYSVDGSSNIDYVFDGSNLTLIPKSHWYGNVNLIVSASDGQYTTQSNYFSVDVLNPREAPTFGNLSCETQILEDASYSCEINVSDLENDPISLEINTQASMNCSLDGNILNYFPNENYNGRAYCVIRASDVDGVNIYRLEVNVTPVNDAPEIIQQIDSVVFDEDNNYTLDLSQYFRDVDSALSYTIAGNDNISYEIDGNDFNFIPKQYWYGNESWTIFASDGEYDTSVEDFLVQVNYKGYAPEFGNLSCNKIIDEDSMESCDLVATDVENDSFSFSVAEENNILCSINGSRLNYISDKDFYGVGYCVLRVSDVDGYRDYRFIVTVNPIADAPQIFSYSPLSDAPQVLENTNVLFHVTSLNVDNDAATILTKWFLNGVQVATGRDYFFNEPFGGYSVKAIVSKGNLSSEKNWNVFVGKSNYFSCSAVGGKICSVNQTCSGQSANTTDTGSCCLSSCVDKPIEFANVPKCDVKSGDIALEMLGISINEAFYLNKSIDGRIRIQNYIGSSKKFDVQVFLYDGTDSTDIDKFQDSIKIGSSEVYTVPFSLDSYSKKAKEDNKYYLYALVKDHNNESVCSSDYIPVSLERESHSVIIDRFDMKNDGEFSCGDIVQFDVGLKNIGLSDENADLTISNSDLKINEDRSVYLEAFGGDDKSMESFAVAIPSDTPAGNYTITATARINSGTFKLEKEIIVGECLKKNTASETANKILTLNQKLTSDVKLADFFGANKFPLILNMIFLDLLMFSLILLVYLKRMKRKKLKDVNGI